MSERVLFITWDGADQNYLVSLFLPIFARTQALGTVSFDVLQYTWASDGQVSATREAAEKVGIGYEQRPVYRRGGALAVPGMMMAGARVVRRMVKAADVDVVFPRSTLPAGMVLIARSLGLKARFVFDADGLPIDERIEAGLLREGSVMARVMRRIERAAVHKSVAVVVRTSAAASILAERAGVKLDKFYVIPNGKDSELFSPGTEEERAAARREIGVSEGEPLLAYVGSVGPQYLPEAAVELFAQVHQLRPGAKLLALTGQVDALVEFANKAGLPASAVVVMRVEPSRVPELLRGADAGLALRSATFSQRGVSPIKVAEYLLCGVPVVTTAGIGDLDQQVDKKWSVVLPGTQSLDLEEAARRIVEDVLPRREEYRAACRANGMEYFELSACARRLSVALAVRK